MYLFCLTSFNWYITDHSWTLSNKIMNFLIPYWIVFFWLSEQEFLYVNLTKSFVNTDRSNKVSHTILPANSKPDQTYETAPLLLPGFSLDKHYLINPGSFSLASCCPNSDSTVKKPLYVSYQQRQAAAHSAKTVQLQNMHFSFIYFIQLKHT